MTLNQVRPLPETTLSPAPLVVLSGPSAAGKTTVADALADAADLDRRTASDRLVDALDGENKIKRLLSWLDQESDYARATDADADRITDLEVLAELQHSGRPLVVESVALPLLLPPDNTALIVQLAARLPVRIARLRGILPELTAGQARTILRRKDRVTGVALRSAWGVDPQAVRVSQWRADLVVQCPDLETCPDPGDCASMAVELIIAAYEVYQGYLTASPVTTAAVHHLGKLLDANHDRVRRCTPLLTDPDGEFSVARWRHRLLLELERARNSARS